MGPVEQETSKIPQMKRIQILYLSILKLPRFVNVVALTACLCIIPPGVVEHQPEIVGVGVLAGIGAVCKNIATRITDFAPGFVHSVSLRDDITHFGNLCA